MSAIICFTAEYQNKQKGSHKWFSGEYKKISKYNNK
jgi:hypothetical protein